MNAFAGRVAVVTGASSGIGRALVQRLAAKGARVAASCIQYEQLQQTMASLPHGTEARAYMVDVSRRDAVFEHAAQVKRDFGGAHFLFNNAGMAVVGTFDHLSIEEIEFQLGVNLWGTIYGTKAFLPMMLAQREGCIVNISSIFGLVGFPTSSAYNLSKFGVRGLTECLWSELEGTGVRAVCVHPGGIRTNIGKSAVRCAAAGSEEQSFDRQAEKFMLTPPEECAANILRGVERGRRRIVTGHRSSTFWWLSRLLPNGYPEVVRALIPK